MIVATASAAEAQRPPVQTQRLSADIGGTFTDVAAFDPKSGQLRFGKTLSTPERLVDGVLTGVGKAGVDFGDCGAFLHGSTIAINTLLERTGAKTALLTTRGFRDIYEIGRVNRPDAYNLYFRKHVPLVERALRFEIDERITAGGEVLVPLADEQVRHIARELGALGIQAIAIMFMHSYRRPDHEIRAKQIVVETCPDVFVTASHEISQEYREFERTSTVVANAFIGPRISTYLDEFNSALDTERYTGPFLIMQSSGGVYEVEQAYRECIRMLESGPAAGLIGARTLCARIGIPNAIAFDMGGTTAKAGVVHGGEVLMTGSSMIGSYLEGLPLQIPMIDIQEVGTGGGSIARLGPGGALRVGPQSAGAAPGPVCYGLGGTAPTVTDANLVLGRLNAENFLGGEMALDVDAARRALEKEVAIPLGLSAIEAADGILRIAANSMANVVRCVTTERGLDASRFDMIAYGGAGPLHASTIAKDLGIGRIVVPHSPGHFSAFGMLAADYRRDFVRSWFMPLGQASFEAIEALYIELEDQGRSEIVGSGVKVDELVVERAADMRYVGQEHTVTVDLPLTLFDGRDLADVKSHFDAVHELRYGYGAPGEEAEIVSLRTSVIGTMGKPTHQRAAEGGEAPPAEARNADREVYFSETGTFIQIPVYGRDGLLAGNRIQGPALIEEYASTTVVHPGDMLHVDDIGNLVVTIGGAP